MAAVEATEPAGYGARLWAAGSTSVTNRPPSMSSTDHGGGKRRGSGLSIIALSLTRDCKPRKAKGATQT